MKAPYEFSAPSRTDIARGPAFIATGVITYVLPAAPFDRKYALSPEINIICDYLNCVILHDTRPWQKKKLFVMN